MAESKSLCSRHWFFGAHLVIDGEAKPESLMGLVKDTLTANPNNSVIGFKDNSSAIRSDFLFLLISPDKSLQTLSKQF